jgi:hypothetical protein
MVEVKGKSGWFEAKRDNSRTVSEDTGPVIGDTESFDDANESPKNITLKHIQAGLERLFQPEPDETRYTEQDGAIFDYGKRRVRTKPGCNEAISESPWRDFAIVAATFKDDFSDEPCSHFKFCNSEQAIPGKIQMHGGSDPNRTHPIPRYR